jgi:deoxyribose-phosphate aldolase
MRIVKDDPIADYDKPAFEDKYISTFNKYNTELDDQDIAKKTENIIKKCLAENDNLEVKKFLLNSVELTSLNTTDNEDSILKMVEKVNDFDSDYPELGNVATICVYPNFASICHDTLENEDVKIACVSGSFPSSQTFSEIKIAETALAIEDGAEEIDMVLPVGKFLAGDYEGAADEIEEMKATCKDKKLKVILETGALKTAENIKKASILAIYAGADYIKTSTGKISVGATPEAAYVMCQTIKEYNDKHNTKIGFKAAGGLKTVKDAIIYYTIVKEILGKEWLNNELFRIGTSSLANLLLSEITGEEKKYF